LKDIIYILTIIILNPEKNLSVSCHYVKVKYDIEITSSRMKSNKYT